MSVFRQAALYLIVALPALAQSQAFATITIKPARSADPSRPLMQVLPGGDLIGSAVPVITLLSYAYDVPSNPSPRLSALSRLDHSREVRHRSESALQSHPY